MALPTLENTLLAFEPISRIVPTTITRITASITAYSAMSWPSSLDHISRKKLVLLIWSSSLVSSPLHSKFARLQRSSQDARLPVATSRSLNFYLWNGHLLRLPVLRLGSSTMANTVSALWGKVGSHSCPPRIFCQHAS